MMSPGYRGEDRSPATKAMDDITDATRKQLGSTLDSVFRTGDAVQRFATDATLFVMFPVLMLMGSSSENQSGNQDKDDQGAASGGQQTADDQAGATPIREAAGGRKR